MLSIVNIALLKVHLVTYLVVLIQAHTVMDCSMDFQAVCVHQGGREAVVSLSK